MRDTLRLAILALLCVGTNGLSSEPPPALTIEANYPGANARDVAEIVAAPIELQINGVDKLLHLRSRSDNAGHYRLTVTFKPGTDLDRVRALVQERVALARPTLPELVKQHGITIKKRPAGVLLLVGLSSPDGSRDTLYLSNYASIQIKDELLELPGISDVLCLGERDYGVRIWLDAEKLQARGLTASEVVLALRKQQLLMGKDGTGLHPKEKERDRPIPLKTLGRLIDVEEVGNIILKAGKDGRVVRLKDVARVELGASGTDNFALLNGKPTVVLAVLASGSFAPRKVASAVQGKLSQLRQRLPEGLRLDSPFDFTGHLEAQSKPPTSQYLLLDPDPLVGTSGERLRKMLEGCEERLRRLKGVEDVLVLSESPFDLPRKRSCLLVRLVPLGKRQANKEEIAQEVRKRLVEVRDLKIRVRDLSGPSAYPSRGYPVALAVHGPEADKVRALATGLAERLSRSDRLSDVWADQDGAPRPLLEVDVDRPALEKLGLSIRDIFSTLQVNTGGADVGDFKLFGRSWRVTIQASKGPLDRVEDLRNLKVRNNKGQMVPLGSVAAIRKGETPLTVERLDGRPMVEVSANLRPGTSPKQARKLTETVLEEVRKEQRLSAEYRLAWLEEFTTSR